MAIAEEPDGVVKSVRFLQEPAINTIRPGTRPNGDKHHGNHTANDISLIDFASLERAKLFLRHM
jgi:hypothetical protein